MEATQPNQVHSLGPVQSRQGICDSLQKSHQRIDLSDYRYLDMKGIVYKNISVADILLAFTYRKINN